MSALRGRGRPVSNPDWARLVKARPAFQIDADTRSALTDVIRERYGGVPRGLSYNALKSLSDARYVCRFYLGGRNRIFAFGDAIDLAVLYDCLLVRFENYRNRRPAQGGHDDAWFNFSRSEAESFLINIPGLAAWLDTLEKHLVEREGLVALADRLANAAEAERQRQSRRTLSGKLESIQDDYRDSVAGIESTLLLLVKSVEAIGARLERLESAPAVYTRGGSYPPLPLDGGHDYTSPPLAPGTPICATDAIRDSGFAPPTA